MSEGGFKVGLALGGGAARALAHIGVLAVLREEGIPVDIITGTSMGAIIGAMYATDLDMEALQERIFSYLESDEFKVAKFDFMKEKDTVEGQGIFFKVSQLARKGFFYTLTMTKKAFVSEEISQRNFAYLVKDIAIEEARIRFAAVALDLVSGQEVILEKGSLRQAMAATCAIPGILHPVEMDGRILVDGGWIDAVPVEAAYRMGADFVIAVDVCNNLNGYEELGSGLDIVFRADAITRQVLSNEQLRKADVVLTPETWKIHWADFSQAARVIQSGRKEAEAHIGEVRRRLRNKRFRALFGKAPKADPSRVLPPPALPDLPG
jgi:NTE family protein